MEKKEKDEEKLPFLPMLRKVLKRLDCFYLISKGRFSPPAFLVFLLQTCPPIADEFAGVKDGRKYSYSGQAVFARGVLSKSYPTEGRNPFNYPFAEIDFSGVNTSVR